MEISTVNSNQNTVTSQGLLRNQKAGTIEELAERGKPADTQGQAKQIQQPSEDRLSLSEDALKLAQGSKAQSNDNQAKISSPQQAQEVLGKLISDIQSDPGQFQFAVASRSLSNLSTLLN